ncbi:hypothetical protein [Paracoccus aestuariivivens]|uniref:hypothetical protein n=1 Tax=Paracoccus aestuariivivens TaxID=1820333 RepID=UPI001479497E|nr:hypothetical protein [Paracoccus aestuariivivens]
MPLPHFLILIVAVILTGALTIWIAASIGIPLYVLGVVALTAAAIVHFATRVDH